MSEYTCSQVKQLEKEVWKNIYEITYIKMREYIKCIIDEQKTGEFQLSPQTCFLNRGIGKTINLMRIAKEINAIVFLSPRSRDRKIKDFCSLGFGEPPQIYKYNGWSTSSQLRNRGMVSNSHNIALVDEGILENSEMYKVIKSMYPVVIKIRDNYAKI